MPHRDRFGRHQRLLFAIGWFICAAILIIGLTAIAISIVEHAG